MHVIRGIYKNCTENGISGKGKVQADALNERRN